MSLYPERANVSDACRKVSRFGVGLNRAARGVKQQCRESRNPSEAAARNLIQSRRDRDDVGSGKPAFVPAIELIVLAANAGEERLLSSQSL